MRALAHISDLHFGTHDPEISRGLLESLSRMRPDLIIVSGDLTQRATSKQFDDARKFLDSLAAPRLIVPGNHDVPMHNAFRRLFQPTRRFQQYIASDLAPFFVDEEIAVLGINTARSLTWKNGRISMNQIELINSRFCHIEGEKNKILVTHHPFISLPNKRRQRAVGRAERYLSSGNGCRPDIALAGHFHTSYSGRLLPAYKAQQGSTLVIQAGTAISRRTRDEENAYNIIRIEKDQVSLTVMIWREGRFIEYNHKRFLRDNGLWKEVE